MQTLNFSCTHCNKLMAVGLASLGMQVRCPHCKQVVVAFQSSGEASTPMINPQDGIPDPSNHHPGPDHSPGTGPEVQIPGEPQVSESGQLEQPQQSPDDFSSLSFSGGTESNASYPPGSPGPQSQESNEGNLAASVPESGSGSFVSSRRQPSRSNNLFLWALVLPLLSYAFLSTVLLVYLYNQYRNVINNSDRLFNLPDEGGDNPGVKKLKTTWKWEINPKLYREPIPTTLLATLRKGQEGQTLHVGDLDVTPVKIEQKVVKVFVEGSNRPEPCDHPSLVLTLRLKNNAAGYSFVPLDSYFDRHFVKPSKEDPYAPLTQIELGSSIFPGGPAHWEPRYTDQRIPLGASRREWVEGRQNLEPELSPGKEMESIVCTDGNNEKLVEAIAKNDGPFLWRVHLRRGLTTHQGKEYPRTAVVGIQFNKDVIETKTP